jgi:hypothetical protein
VLTLCGSCHRWVELDARSTAEAREGPVGVCDDCRDDAPVGPAARVRAALPL